jgi:hypothetical protein
MSSKNNYWEPIQAFRSLRSDHNYWSSALSSRALIIERPTIVYLGSHRLYAMGSEIRVVTETEDILLRAFLSKGAMDSKMLEQECYGKHAVKTLKRLKSKYNGIFSEAITTPGVKGNGGYFVRIIRDNGSS